VDEMCTNKKGCISSPLFLLHIIGGGGMDAAHPCASPLRGALWDVQICSRQICEPQVLGEIKKPPLGWLLYLLVEARGIEPLSASSPPLALHV